MDFAARTAFREYHAIFRWIFIRPASRNIMALRRLLFSCEFLTPKELVEKKGVELMADTGAYFSSRTLYKDLESPHFKEMLKKFKDLGIEKHFIPWPMLNVEDGYYANTKTVDKFSMLVKKTLDWYCDHGIEVPDGMLIDLEPSTDPEAAKKAEQYRLEGKPPEKKGFDAMAVVGKIIDQIDEIDENLFEESSRKFSEMQDMMHGYGTKAIAVALPLAYEDIFDNRLLIQNFMTCPVTSVKWDMINFMIFNTDYVAPTKGIITNEEYRHLLYAYGKEFVDRWGAEKASICLGITNTGITDIRATQTDPALYKQEVGALLASGIQDVGIYALDGVLQQPDPKGWIETVMSGKASDFKVDKEKLEVANLVRRAFQAVDFITPIGKYLVDSGKIMNIMQMFLDKK